MIGHTSNPRRSGIYVETYQVERRGRSSLAWSPARTYWGPFATKDEAKAWQKQRRQQGKDPGRIV